MERKKKIAYTSSIAFERGNLVLAIISMLIGGYLSLIFPPLVNDPLNPNYWSLWLLIAACILLMIGIGGFLIVANRHKADSSTAIYTISKQAIEMKQSSKEIFTLIEQTVTRQAALIPRGEVYLEMSQAIDDATSEISVVTLLAVDWTSGRRNFAPALTDTPGRTRFYESIKRAIAREDILYERIWQIPAEKKIEEVKEALFSDPLHKEEYKLVEEHKQKNPHLAKFMLSPTLTTASFILIDKKKLFFNFDIYNEETNELESPYMLFIKEASGEVFSPLKALIARFKPIEFKLSETEK